MPSPPASSGTQREWPRRKRKNSSGKSLPGGRGRLTRLCGRFCSSSKGRPTSPGKSSGSTADTGCEEGPVEEIYLPLDEKKVLLPSISGKITVCRPKIPRTPDDPAEIISKALDTPLSGPPLTERLRGKKSLAIVIPDVTRESGAAHFLPLILSRAEEAGISPRAVTLFVALGIHRPLTEEEVDRITGGTSRTLRVVQHDPDRGLKDLGKTSRGTPVLINAELLKHDAIVLAGAASFHYFAGFGGGRKLLVPGLAGRETIYSTHRRIFDGTERSPLARPGVLSGNPVHEDMLEAASFVPVTFSLTTLLSPEKKVFHAVGGGLEDSHEEACRVYAEHFAVKLKKRYPFIIASAGGYPKDINFIQSHKALDHSFQALSPGGVLILAAWCRDGLGHDDFFPWFRFGTPERIAGELRKNYVVYGQTAFATLTKTLSCTVILVSSLPAETVEAMNIVPARNIEEALSIARERGAVTDEVLVIPEAGHVLPLVEGGEKDTRGAR
ncbi:MAG: nickel-dependent lactate racemase [Deltaproteobacteria bacterium]|nr:MAG: nickel-dependent lactate racemase [Deltaproteobacteria bacterium]